ncbi:T9SS type A sorting domain-containing protein [Bacteroidia bacterium]|nr:T9SS type A sorting domain-containing protein [Bacteroidia bacterium]
MRLTKLILSVFVLFIATQKSVEAQVAKTQVIMVNATTTGNTATIKWPTKTFTGNYYIYKRVSLSTMDWGSPIATLSSSSTSYTDNNLMEGTSAEYRVIAANGSQAQAFGYIYVGNKLTEILQKGGILLMIDSTFITSLASEITRLENDLESEGWNVGKFYVGRSQTAIEGKNLLKTAVNQSSFSVTTLMLLGNVPVPYSGDFSAAGASPPPDGHVEGSGNHTGAWPADAYYGDLDGAWTDNFVIRTSGNQSRHHNIVGDGKFDQTKLPSDLELEVGRVDLSRMTAFTSSETELMRSYFDRNHAWRTQQRTVVERALVDNNFGSLNLASTGYHNFSAFFPFDSIQDKDYITSQTQGSYLWSYGCGAGSYTSCNGIGNTNSIRDNNINNVFTILAGSFFGDFDITNNFLRAPLCKTSLASFWGGIPKWYVHTMALGKHIGYGARTSINNQSFYFNGQFNNAHYLVSNALMGDPTLMNRHLPQVDWVMASSASNQVKLNWSKAQGTFDGYAVYRIDTAQNTTFRVNAQPITDTFYTDAINWYSGNYKYEVRPIKLETTASGSYYNVGGGSYAFVDHINSAKDITKEPFIVYPNPSKGSYKVKGSGINQIQITDLMGKSVPFTQTDDLINITSAPSGLYLMHVKFTDGSVGTTQLIKE